MKTKIKRYHDYSQIDKEDHEVEDLTEQMEKEAEQIEKLNE
ncbi:hypothetical protein LCGC14_1692290 [marine sediment metagenome]|uniref:Uncharacterized protein n=1 Tax=marine sediment metagenome TaxID=412755 RepID=A0A0F9HKE1_9ZZZZ